MKNEKPVPANEKDRINALHSYGILDTLPEEQFDRLTSLASIICDVPISLISLSDTNRQWFKSGKGFEDREISRDISFCQYAIMDKEFFEVEDATKDERFSDNPLVTKNPKIKFYAAYPLVNPDGYTIGTLCLLDHKSKKLSENQRLALKLLSEEVMTQITLRYETRIKEKLERFFNMAEDLICIAGTDGYLKKVNPAFTEILGWKPAELMSESVYDFIHPDDIEITKREIEKLSLGIKTIGFTIRFRTAEGTYKFLEWGASPDPETGEMLAIARDITEKREQEKERQKFLKEIRDIKNALDEFAIVAITDPKGDIIYANDKFCEVSQYTREELIGKNHRILNSGYHSKEFFIDLWQTIVKGKVWKGEIRNQRKNGSFYWVDTTIVPFLNDAGKPYQYVVIRYEISERKEFESRIYELSNFQKSILDGTDFSIISTDPGGIIKLFNKGAEKMLGFSAGEMIGRQFPAFLHDHSEMVRRAGELSKELGLPVQADFDSLVAKSRILGQPDVNEWTYVCKDGSKINVILSVTTLFGKNKEIIGYLSAARDITDRIFIENELRKAKELAEKNVKAKDLFLANMSHEIRTPMNAIIGYADVLQSTPLSNEQKEYLDAITSAGENLLVIINDILDFSKIESGTVTLEKNPINIPGILNTIKKLLAGKANQKQVSLNFNTENQIPQWVIGDQVRLDQILINLVGNAIKFTGKGEVAVNTRLISIENNICWIEFAVRDTGIGIPVDKQEKIFERFIQADSNITRKYQGTGLGLSITQKLIELFGGSISLKSEIGKGSEFTFRIPFEITEKAPQAEAIKVEQDFLPEAELNILLVEDNELNRKLASKVLEKTGKITLAENGSEAIEILKKKTFDIILMDLQMPVMDGYVATSYIRKVLKLNTPIIALTAHSFTGEREKCLSSGMNEYISKPYKAAEMIEKIQSVRKISIKTMEQNAKMKNRGRENGKKEPESKLYNFAELMNLSGNDKEFVKESVQIFVRDIPQDIGKLEENLKTKQFDIIKRIVHKMKSSFGLFQAREAVELCKKIELSPDPAEMESNTVELKTLSTKILEDLKEEFQN